MEGRKDDLMNSYDPKKAAAVWQRVQGQTPAPPDSASLLTLIAQEQEDASTYLHLSRQFTGKESAALRQMAYQEQSHAACLRGIYALLTGKKPALHTPPAPLENRQVLLRRCYGREMQSLTQYKARTDDPQYGHIFTRLAAQEQEHCHILLGILGNLKDS